MKQSRALSFAEEVANSISHGIGSLLMLILLPITAAYALTIYDIKAAVGMSIFVISLFLMFLSSTLYHAMAYHSRHKQIFRIIDHSMIYVAIAGSYTPVALLLVGNTLGYAILVLQWGLTIVGILYKIFATRINDKISTVMYIMMGWVVVAIIPIIIQQTTVEFCLLMLAGGLCYTVGAVIYLQKKPYCHLVWHLCILVAAVCQYVAIVFWMI